MQPRIDELASLNLAGASALAVARRLEAAGLGAPLACALASASDACARAVTSSALELTDQDRIDLVAAYHRAESLAQYAIEAALAQVRDGERRAALSEQLEDEQRHIDVFAGWLGQVHAVERPRPKTRPDAVWYALLLVNELTGYCQFQMLAALVESSAQGAELKGVLEDEEAHITRLASWLRADWEGASGPLLRQLVDRFCRDLGGRMAQFFPRRELEALRVEVARAIAEAVRCAPLG